MVGQFSLDHLLACGEMNIIVSKIFGVIVGEILQSVFASSNTDAIGLFCVLKLNIANF